MEISSYILNAIGLVCILAASILKNVGMKMIEILMQVLILCLKD